MRKIVSIASLLIAAAAPACADPGTMLNGRMPSLSQGRAPGTSLYAPSPVPNPDVDAPRGAKDPYAVAVVPGLTRTETDKITGEGFSPGSNFSGTMERRDRSAGGIGSTLAPSLRVKVPVQVDFR